MSSETADTLKKKTLPLLRAVLTAKAKVGVPLHMLLREFEETCMEPLKFREMGYGSLEQFLRDCSDTCTVMRAKEGYLVVKGIASKEDAHIYKLVSGQRKDRKKTKRFGGPAKNRTAAHFSSGKKPNFKPSIRYFMPSPQRSLLGTPPTHRTLLPTTVYHQYPQLRQTPTKYFRSNSGSNNEPYIMNNELAPRFQRQKQNNNSASYVSKVQSQVNKKSLQMTVFQNNLSVSESSTKSYDANNAYVKTSLSPQALASLEKKLQNLLITKSNGLWATRLRPEFQTMYGEILPDDVKEIIQENFLSFIKIDSPMPHMDILYLKEGAREKLEESPPVINDETQRKVVIKEMSQQDENLHHVTNGIAYHNNTCNGVEEALPDVICTGSSDGPSTKHIKQKSLSPRSTEFKIESPDLPNVGDAIKVFVCHVESLDRFFVQFADSEIQDLVDEMQLYYEDRSCSEEIGKPRLDEYCCSRYSKDKLWFRSKILSVKEQKNILNESYRCHVIYVDYGNDEYVISTELKCLTQEFCKIPAQAVQCSLHKLFPVKGTTWSEDVIEHFKQVTDNVELTMSIKEKNGSVLSIDLIDTNGQSVCAYLCLFKLAKNSFPPDNVPSHEASPDTTSPKCSSPIDKVSYDSETFVSLPPSNREIKPKYVTVPTEQDYVDISVSHINSTNDFAIVLIGPEYEEQLDRLEEKMSKYYEKESILSVVTLEVDDFYAISYEDDWVRVKLLAVYDTEIEVILLDRGNKTIVSKEELKDLPTWFWEPPFQAIPCSLANVPESFDAEILQYLTETTLRKDLIGYIVERCDVGGMKISIELYDTTNESDDININNEIIEKIENEKNLCPRLPEVGEGHCNAYIAHISQSGEVFIQILGPGTERLEILMEDMTSHFTQTRALEIVQRPEVGNICCAKFYDDGAWYRAKVTKVMWKERKVEVEFIDYGNHEVIQMLFIRNPNAVNKKVVSLPAQAVKCQVYGLSESDMNEETWKQIRDFTQSLDVVYVSVIEYNENNIPVIKILLPSQHQDTDPIDFLEKYEYDHLENIKLSSDNGSSSVFNTTSSDTVSQHLNISSDGTNSVFDTTYKDTIGFNTIPNIDGTSFEDISVAGEESYCKINSVKPNDSNTILSEYDVINNVPNDVGKSCSERNRSESPAFLFSSAWGIPQMMITESVIEGVIQDSHDPSKFSFIPYRLWDALEALHVEMMEMYNHSTCDDVTYKVGDVYAVYHHEHEIWYRAVIVAEIEDEVVVKYLDFSGTAEVEASKNIRELLPQFKALPFLAVRCTLAGIEPNGGGKNWNSETAHLFNEMVLNKTFHIEILTTMRYLNNFSTPVQVLLHGATEDGKPFVVNEKLVQMGFARKTR